MREDKKIHQLVQGAMIAAIYTALTVSLAPISFGVIQFRVSEALCVLPFFTPAAVPGLFIGCLISNILTGCAIPDIIFGSLATLIGALGTWKLRGSKNIFPGNVFLAPLPPILANTIIVPFVLRYAYGIRPLWLSFLTVGAGEIISCGILGLLLAFTLNKYRSQIFRESF